MYAEVTLRRSAHPLLLYLACALSLLLPVACALTDATVVLPKARLAPSIESGRRRQVIVTMPFQDAREIRRRCGMKKNSYEMDTADLQCTTYIEGYPSPRAQLSGSPICSRRSSDGRGLRS